VQTDRDLRAGETDRSEGIMHAVNRLHLEDANATKNNIMEAGQVDVVANQEGEAVTRHAKPQRVVGHYREWKQQFRTVEKDLKRLTSGSAS